LQKDLFSKIKIVGDPLYVGLDSFAVKEGNKILLSILNKGIKLAKKRGIITSIERKWLGASYIKSNKYRDLLKIAYITAIVLFFLIVFIYVWNLILQKKINEKTEELATKNKQLKESEERFRGFFEKSLIPFSLINEELKYFDCNDAALNILEAEDKESFFLSAGELSPKYQPDGQLSTEKAKKLITEVFKTGRSLSFEWMLKKFNGETFWAIVTLSLVPFGEKKAVLVTWADISELKQLQKILEEEKQELEVTLKSIGDAVIKVDKEGKVELMNNVAEQLTGWSFEQAKGEKLEKVFKIFNTLKKGNQENLLYKVLNTGKIETLSNHTILISKSGETYHIEDSAAPIRDKENNIIGAIVVFRDVTEKVQQQQELIKADKLRSLGILAGGIAHDFNNMLTGIFGYISLAKQSLNERDPAYKFLEKAEKSSERAEHLTKQLLTFSKGGEPVLENVDIATLIKETVKFHLRGSKIKPIFNFDNTSIKIKVDKGQISQVLANLTVNASEAMPQGGNIYISLSNTENPLPDLKGNFLKITFQDEGIGISPDIIDKIFEPYFTTKSAGNGLGLATVYSIITKHNGKILVESEQGKGTTFTIFLPADLELKEYKTDKEEISNDNLENSVKDEKPFKILVMDDEEDIREFFIWTI
jgi:PAS domain S-box-containing protein